jgi:hypothetical protein
MIMPAQWMSYCSWEGSNLRGFGNSWAFFTSEYLEIAYELSPTPIGHQRSVTLLAREIDGGEDLVRRNA